MEDRKPEKIAGRIECEIWSSCVYGADCMLSPFKSSSKKKMPLLVIEDGTPICQDVKRG